jgi:hypothetical protein
MRGIFTLGLILMAAAQMRTLNAAAPTERYAVVLTDPPVAEFSASHKNATAAAIENERQKIRAAQASLRHELESRGFVITGSVENVLNAVFVQASPDRVPELRALPGVKSVVKMRNKRPLGRAASKHKYG